MPKEVGKPHLLLVEGQDEVRFFSKLLSHIGINSVQVEGAGGKDKFSTKLAGWVKASGFSQVRSLGVVRDADRDPAAAVESIKSSLRAENLPVPSSAGRVEVMADRRPTATGILILPNSESWGSLESLILSSVQDQKQFTCVERFFGCLERQEVLPQFCRTSTEKRQVLVFLGSQDTSARLLGEAAEAGIWPLGSTVFEDVAKFLSDLASH